MRALPQALMGLNREENNASKWAGEWHAGIAGVKSGAEGPAFARNARCHALRF
jgi:hypothetical protein